ncbi:MAG: hypothetical protein AB7H80_08600 [Candidatus Kapaibacterium sp.]
MRFTTTIIAGFFLIVCTSTAQELRVRQVPDVVVQAFQSAYPDVSSPEWEQEQEGEYFEAEFEIHGIEHSIRISAEGSIVATEVEMSISDIPSSIITFIARSYAGYEIEEGTKVTTHDGTFFEVEIAGKGKEYELLFDTEGNPVKREKEEGDGDDD